MRKLWRRVYFLLHRRRLERELAEEMAAHREMMPAARHAHFGNDTRLREQVREQWSWIWLEQLGQDLAYGARALRRSPAFALGAAIVLALGVGVNLAEFQIFDAMVFHRLGFRDASSFLQFSHVFRHGNRLGFPPGAVDFYRSESKSFAWLLAEDNTSTVVLEGDAGLRASLVSGDYFGSLAILPAWGRLLDPRDERRGAPPVAVLGYRYWQTRWGGDPHVTGRAVRINGQAVRIVGVAPYDFDGLQPRRTDVWLPVTARPLLIPGSLPPGQDFSHPVEALYGKLKAGVPQAAGEAELTVLTRELGRRNPREFQPDERIRAELVENRMRAVMRSPAVAVFMLIVLLVLLSACANLANMLLARGLARQREMAIRAAIGAGRARMVRQLMTENLLLALLGAAAGLAFGTASARLLLAAVDAPPDIHILMRWPVLLAALVLTLVSVAAFGLPAAWGTVRPDHRKARLRQGLVGIQVAVSCLLLIASGVLAHNGIASASLGLAFDYRNMVVVYPQLYAQSLTAGAAQQKLDALGSRLGAAPGVVGVTAAVNPPFGGRPTIETPPGAPHVYRNAVAPSYFSVVGLRVERGRTFTPGEQMAAIVSESAARAIWPDQDPIGKTWRLAGADRTVVGVVEDSGANLLADSDSVEAYVPIDRAEADRSALLVHTRGDPAALVRAATAVGASLDETVSVVLLRASRDEVLAAQRRMITLIGSIGVVAAALAAAGMFALVAFAVAQRRRELGVRIAIGAAPRHILRALLAQNIRPMAAGAAVGTVLAAVISRLMRTVVILPNRDRLDAVGFAAGIAGFAAVAALAMLWPAVRALRIDPAATLREE